MIDRDVIDHIVAAFLNEKLVLNPSEIEEYCPELFQLLHNRFGAPLEELRRVLSNPKKVTLENGYFCSNASTPRTYVDLANIANECSVIPFSQQDLDTIFAV